MAVVLILILICFFAQFRSGSPFTYIFHCSHSRQRNNWTDANKKGLCVYRYRREFIATLPSSFSLSHFPWEPTLQFCFTNFALFLFRGARLHPSGVPRGTKFKQCRAIILPFRTEMNIVLIDSDCSLKPEPNSNEQLPPVCLPRTSSPTIFMCSAVKTAKEIGIRSSLARKTKLKINNSKQTTCAV